MASSVSVFAVFGKHSGLEYAVAKLRLSGFRMDDLTIFPLTASRSSDRIDASGLQFDEYEERRQSGKVGDRVMLSVPCDDAAWVTQAAEILDQCGGEDVASACEIGEDTGRRNFTS